MISSLKNSDFQKRILKANYKTFELSPDKPASPLPELFTSDWLVFMDTPENLPYKNAIDGLFANAAKSIEQIRKIYGDKRFTNSGALDQAVDIAFKYFSSSSRDSIFQIKGMIEDGAGKLSAEFNALAIPTTNTETGAEWRAFMRTAGNDERERLVALNQLVVDGNDEIIPAILQANPGLSGISKRTHDALLYRTRIASNVDKFTKLRMRAECLSVLTMSTIRAAIAVVTATRLSPEIQKQYLVSYAGFEAFEKMNALSVTIEATEAAIRAFGGAAFVDFSQMENEEEIAAKAQAEENETTRKIAANEAEAKEKAKHPYGK